MPPEPLPWDRRDSSFKDRKHERGPSCDALAGGGGGSGHRWKDTLAASSDFSHASPRREGHHHRQGGGYYRVYPEESWGGLACTPSRSSGKFCGEDDSFRASSARFGGGRSGSSRESRGFGRRSPYSDSGDFARQRHDAPVTALRSVAVPVSQSSSPHILKDQHDKSGDFSRQHHDRSLGSIGWKPHKWTRSLSLKNARSDLDEVGIDVSSVPAGKETPIRSPVMSPLLSDEGGLRKKQRLGWGQGLAKFEKKKIEGSADLSAHNGLMLPCDDSAKDSSNKTSPKPTATAGCTSPATLCSAVSSSSPGVLDKGCIKEANNESSQLDDSSDHGIQNCLNELPVKLDPLEVNSSSSLTSLLSDLLQPEDACSGDSSFTRHAAMNKLLVLKGDISKELEKTECEIDLFENELKTLNGDRKNDHSLSPFSLKADCASDPCVEQPGHSSQLLSDSTPLNDCALPSSVSRTERLSKSLVHSVFLADHAMVVKDVNDDSQEACSFKCGKAAASQMAGISESKAPRLTRCSFSIGNAATNLCDRGDGNFLDACGTSEFSNLDTGFNIEADNLILSITASNRRAATEASQVFEKAMAIGPSQFDFWGQGNDVHIKEKLAMHKKHLKFKERLLTLKFRAFHHLWKEDLRLLSMRKHKPKSQKRFELSSRAAQSGPQKHRSSIRSRFTLPAGNLTLVPTTEIVDFTTKLLSDSQTKLYRNYLKVPALILDEKEKSYSRFITNNCLIEDPPAFEVETSMINSWTEEEKEVFMKSLVTFGKDFTKIASFLSHKTTADCIEFYYKYHKSGSFEEVRRLMQPKKQQNCLPTNMYLITPGNKWNREANAAASLDMLGGASSVEISRYERETAAVDALAGICGALSSEAMGSCVTSSIDPAERMKFVTIGRPLTSDVTQSIDEDDTCSDEGCGEVESVDWTDEEKLAFIRALGIYGKDFAKIASFVGVRSREQCKIFFSKARKCLGLDVIHPAPSNGGTLTTDMNGGGSDTDGTCAAEIDSASTQSCSKLDADIIHSAVNTSIQGFRPAGNSPMHTELGESNQKEAEAEIDRLIVSTEDEMVLSDAVDNKKTDEVEEDHLSTPVKPAIDECMEPVRSEIHGVSDVQLDHTEGNIPDDPGSKNDVDPPQFVVPLSSGDISLSDELLLPSLQKQLGIVVPKEEKVVNLPLDKVLPDPSSIGFNSLHQFSLNFEGTGNRDIYHMGSSRINQPSHIFRGYPVQMLSQKEADPIGEGPGGGNVGSQFYPSDMHIGHPWSESSEKQETRIRPCSQSSEESSRIGDVKLFGQILTTPCLRKSNSPKQRCSLSPDEQQQPPLRSYGFWDGTRIQTGYTSLPESAIVLATRNGFETISGILPFRCYSSVGSEPSQDPVAALKMQYAGRAKICKSEVETWKRET